MIRKLTLFILLGVYQIHTINYYPFFYRTKPFTDEPRFSKDGLTSFHPFVRGGHATCGYDGCKNHVNPLAIYGCENIYALAKGVPASTLNCNPDGFINTLWEETPAQCNFGKVKVNGKMGMSELFLPLTQNLKHGFFVSLTIPIQHVGISNVTFCDQTTQASTGSEINYIQWQAFINELYQNLAPYGTFAGNTSTSGLGDVQLYGGWTYNYEETKHLDFIDFTIALGLNLPTGSPSKACLPWQLPLGYDNHLGIPIFGTISFGIFDWLTLGLQSGAIWFKDRTRIMPLKTAAEQSGWIRLAHDYANVNKGTIWHVDGYVKADHLVGGFSFIFGFSHDHANQTCVKPCNTYLYNATIVNSEERYLPWTMTSFHFVLDYDFANFKHPNAPRLGFTIDKSMTGERSFDTAIFGSYIGIDIEWRF